MNTRKIPKVTVVLPAYNSAATIRRALDSICAQSFRDFEIIAVDDGSSDETVAVIEAAGIETLTLLRHEKNRGAAAARNTALQSARGDLVAFLDSDDSWRPDKLSQQVAALENTAPDVKACTSGCTIHRMSGDQEVRIELKPGEFRSTILFGCAISPGTTLVVDRRAFNEIGPFDDTLRRLEDWDWLLRFTQRYDMCSVPEPLADIYLSESAAADSPEMSESVLHALRQIRAKHVARLPSARERHQLISSILVERAAIRYRSGQALQAAFTVILAFAVFPRRNKAFFRMLTRSSLNLIRKSGDSQS